MKLFIRWSIVNSIILTLLIVIYIIERQTINNLNIVGKAFLLSELFLYFVCTLEAALLSYWADKEILSISPKLASKFYLPILHNAKAIQFGASLSPLIGLMGADVGIYKALTTSGGLGEAATQAIILANAGVAFLPTIFGIFVCVALLVIHHIITHEIEK